MQKRPNILFFFPDQHRGDWTGYRNQQGVRTPNLDRLARIGQVFPNALSPSPVCSPARACFAASQPYDVQKVRHNQHDVDPADPNIYQALRDTGYHVLGCGKFDLLKMSMDWGVSGLHGGGQGSRLRELGFTDGIDNAGKQDFVTGYRRGVGDPFQEFLRQQELLTTHISDYAERGYGERNYTNTRPTPLPDFAYGDNWIAGNGLKLLEGMCDDDPWFLQVNFNGPHEPMDVTASMQARWKDTVLAPPIDSRELSLDHHQAIRRNYAAMIENVDRHLGLYLAYLNERGWTDNSIVIYASDHGEMLGDRELWGKVVPFQPSVSIPMVIAGAGIEARGEVNHAWIDLVDLARTIISFASASPPPDSHGSIITEVSLPRHKVIGLGSWRAVYEGTMKYVHNFADGMSGPDVVASFDPSPEAPCLLYDLQQDPNERADLSRINAPEAKRLRELLLNEVMSLRN